MKFCPRCGMEGAAEAARDDAPLNLNVGPRRYQVGDRLAIGSICTIYRCRVQSRRGVLEGTFKIARDARTNGLVANEAGVLRHLHQHDDGRFAPFLPAVEDSFQLSGDPSGPPRQANVLRLHEEIATPDELYSLAEVRARYSGGLEGRDVAWIWRRLLTILGYAHARNVIHAAVLPMHVMIEPREHKLVLIDWCCAAIGAPAEPPIIITGGHLSWYQRQEALSAPPTPALDIGLGARSMIELLGGDPVRGEFPPAVEPALQRYFKRCLTGACDAAKLLEDFDQLIEALWGPRKFRVLAMPPRKNAAPARR